MKAIIPGLYTFTGLIAGRVYMIDDPDGVTLIDASIAPAGKRILRQLQAAGRTPADVKRILITHAHPDHVGALPELKAATGAEVICSVVDTPVAEGRAPIVSPPRETLTGISRFLVPPRTLLKGITVDREISDGDVLTEIMGGLHVVATPGHSPGHLAFWQPERKVLIVGDAIMRLFGRVRVPLAMLTADMDAARRSIARLTDYDAQVVCFGHGEPITHNGGEAIRALARQIGVGVSGG